jgi:hypothetical protein
MGAATTNPHRREVLLYRMMKVIMVRSASQRPASNSCNFHPSSSTAKADGGEAP